MPDVIPADQLPAELSRLDGWTGDTSAITRTSQLPSFPAAIEAVRRVADVAEQMNHHPDIDIRYRTVTFTCSTHSAGGVTDLDLELARQIDDIVSSAGG